MLIVNDLHCAKTRLDGCSGSVAFVRESRVNRGNTLHVTMNVTITEAISTERSKLGVGWRFWRVEREERKSKTPHAHPAYGAPKFVFEVSALATYLLVLFHRPAVFFLGNLLSQSFSEVLKIWLVLRLPLGRTFQNRDLD